jgi:hypothetical protein
VAESNSTSDATKSTDVNKTDSSLNAVGKLMSTTEKSSTSPSKKVEPDVRRPALLECPHCDELKGNDDAPNLRLHIFHHYKEHWLERVSMSFRVFLSFRGFPFFNFDKNTQTDNKQTSIY